MIHRIALAIGIAGAGCASAPAGGEALVVVVATVQVRPEGRETFEALSRELVEQSRREAGVRRFDLLRATEGPNRYVFVEVFVDAFAHADHMARRHTRVWFDAVKAILQLPPSVDVFDASSRLASNM